MPIDPRVLELEKAAESLRRAGDHPEAIKKINEALAIDPKFVRGHLALAVLYHHTGELELAVGHAERACEIEPGDSFNFAALSVTCQRAFEATRDPAWIHRAEAAMARSRGVG
jgi:tetratricopeptide (TPR) repeat protein